MKNSFVVFMVLVLFFGFSVTHTSASPNLNDSRNSNWFYAESRGDKNQSGPADSRAELAIRLHQVFYPQALVKPVSLSAMISNMLAKRKGPSNQNSISKTISDMTLSEKVGQMIIAGISGTAPNSNTSSLIKDYQIGGLILYADNLLDTNQSVTLLNQLKAENRSNPFPLFLSVDQEGGKVSRLPGSLLDFPANETIGNVKNAQYSYEIGKILGEELSAFGFNVNFAPVLDINSNPNNPVIGDRSFDDDPGTVSKLGIQTMKGMQSQKIISVIKHFPGHGDTSVDSHLELPVVNKSQEELEQLELIPFTEAIENGADTVMVAHILLPKLDAEYPATLSPTIIHDLLRDQMNYDGVVITDDMTMQAITDHYGSGEAAVQSVIAGSDILLVAHNYNSIVKTYEAIIEAVEEGVISEERIDESVTRILQLKKKYEVTDEKVSLVSTEEINRQIRDLNDKYLD